MIIQLNPPIPLTTPNGNGLAWFLIDYGVEHNLMWTVAIDETGEIWTYQNHEVRAQKNITMQRVNKELENVSQEQLLKTQNSLVFYADKNNIR